MSKHYLYQHTRLDKDEIFYIGVGTNQDVEYYSRSKEKHGRSSIWKKIVAKTEYRIDIILESDDYAFILEKEKEFVTLYGRKNINTGPLANLTDGGEGCLGMVLSQESKDKIAAGNRGKVISLETRLKMSIVRTGKVKSEETKLRISIANKGKHRGSIPHTEESKRKISESRLGAKHTRSRKVVDTVTKEEFDTCTAAATSVGINRGYLSNMLSGKCKNKTNFKYI